MIRINRPAAVPQILIVDGSIECKRSCADYDARPFAYQQGIALHLFDRSLYASDVVKSLLSQCQYGKCCFCESKVTHIAYGDVEHFRPKAAVKQRPSDALTKPGYYWLAYDWSNLLLACQLCNQRAKGNLFPLMNSKRRAKCHHDNIGRERPYFINPAIEDPEDFIAYREEFLYAVGGSRRGQATIKYLQLNTREDLVEKRRDYLRILRELKIAKREIEKAIREKQGRGDPVEQATIEVLEGLRAICRERKRPEMEYSSMAKAVLR